MHTIHTLWMYKEDAVIEAETKPETIGFGTIYLTIGDSELVLYFKPETTHNLAEAFGKIATDLRRISNEQRAEEDTATRGQARLREPLGEDGPLPEAIAPTQRPPC